MYSKSKKQFFDWRNFFRSTHRTALAITVAVGMAMFIGSQAVANVLVLSDARIVNVELESVSTPKNILIDTDSGTISLITPAGEPIPEGAEVIDATGKFVVPGLINGHWHYEPFPDVFGSPESRTIADLQRKTDKLILRYGFTTVMDNGSDPAGTLFITNLNREGTLRGPEVHSAGDAFVPHPDGTPVFLRPLVLRDPATPEEISAFISEDSINFPDELFYGVKLFVGSPQQEPPGGLMLMDIDIVMAAVQTAHGLGKRVFAHPQGQLGAAIAVDGGVDHFTHLIGLDDPQNKALYEQMVANGISLNPTLTLFQALDITEGETGILAKVQEELRFFLDIGGTVIFGNDVFSDEVFNRTGDPRREYELMKEAGMSAFEILRSITVVPRAFIEGIDPVGMPPLIRVGAPADLVVLSSDPTLDAVNLTTVEVVVGKGRILWTPELDTTIGGMF